MKNHTVKKFIKLHWVKMVVALCAVAFIITSIYLIAIGLKNFFELESFYKKMALANIPLTIFLSIISAFIFAGIYSFMHMWLLYGGGMAKLSQKKVKPSEVNVKWSDVVGMEGIKKEVWEAIDLIKDRAQLKRVGGKIIKGILMVGPPGCGKTYLAKAIATETNLPFLSASGSEFVGTFVGIGASRLKSLFKEARVLAELHGGCVIFIDEIDSIARPRMADYGGGAGIDHNATINQLLTEMDGLNQKESNIIVIAATNVIEEDLDPAIIRPGRFDRKITVVKPGLEDRRKLFDYYLQKTTFDPAIKTEILARRALGFSPADIFDMVRESSLIAIRNKHEAITYKDLSEAYDRVVFGMKSGIILSGEEKIWVAYHEAGHAIIAFLTHPTDDVIKASIIPRKGYLGVVGHRPQEEIHINNKEYLLANIKMSLASYVAEKIKFGKTGSGVDSDFSTALWYAHNMVWRWGMGESGFLGNFHAIGTNSTWGGSSAPEYISEKTKEALDADVQKILRSCLSEVESIIVKEKELFEYFAQELLKKEELEYDEIIEIFKKHGKERSQVHIN